MLTTKYAFSEYEEMISSSFWQGRLRDLNKTLMRSMRDVEKPHALNGNLFYTHMDPDFVTSNLLERFEPKRRNFFYLAKQVETLFEVGVNGGHSLFLALSSNPELRVFGVDICEKMDASWGPVEKYVPAAFKWLAKEFPGRCTFIKGNSLVELPKFSLENPDLVIDLLHLDGAKDTHLRETLAMLPNMRSSSYIVFDDAGTRPVAKSMQQIKELNIARPVKLEHFGVYRTGAHRVFKVTGL